MSAQILRREPLFNLLRLSGLPFVIRELVNRRRTTVVMYHDIDPETLDRHLSVLGRRYHFIPLRRYVDALWSHEVDSLPSKSMVITLDDGLSGNYALVEVFRKHGVTPTIFVCTGIVGTNRRFWTSAVGSRDEARRLKGMADEARLEALASLGFAETSSHPDRSALSRAEISEMLDTVDFQSHGVLHPILNQCTDERSRREIFDSKETLERVYGLDVYAFAFPNGDFSEREIQYVRSAGYRCAVTAEIGFNGADTDPYRLKRLGIPGSASESEIVVKACAMRAPHWDLGLRV